MDAFRSRPALRTSFVAAAILALAWVGRAPAQYPAQRYGRNPVEELRQALAVPVLDPATDLPVHKRTVRQRITALRGLGELRQALMLPQWADEGEEAVARADQELRGEIVNRLERGLRAAMREADPAARIAAATMIGEMGLAVRGVGTKAPLARELAPDLADLTHDQNPRVAEAAARALGRIDPDARIAIPALQALLGDDAPELRRAAAAALRDMVQTVSRSELSITSAREAIQREQRRTAAGMPEVRPGDAQRAARAVVPAAARGAKDGDALVRRLCLEALQASAYILSDAIGGPGGPGRVMPESDRRPGAAAPGVPAGVGDRRPEGDRADVQPLIRAFRDQAGTLAAALDDPDPRIRLLACRTLEDLATARQKLERRAGEGRRPAPASDPLMQLLQTALPGLTARVTDRDVQVRLAALDVLELLEDAAKPAAAAIIGATADPNLFVRWAAARTLGRMGTVDTDNSVPALARLLGDADLDVRRTAAATLERYGPSARAAVPALVESTRKGDAEIRIAAMYALEAIGKDAEPAIPALADALRHDDARVRQSAAEALGRFGPAAREAEPGLRRALTDDDPDVRRAASDALLDILPPKTGREK